MDANPRNGGMMLSEQQRTALVQAQTEQALSYIEDYLKDEFEITEPDFSDLTRIDLGYTTTEDEKHVIQVYADLEHCTVTKLVDDTLYAQERYGSLDDLNQAVLSNLDFDSLMEIGLDEAEEHEPQENVLPTDESAAQAPTNYLAPYEPEIPTGAKAKFTANLNAIQTLKQIEQRGTPATKAEQNVLAGHLGWGGLADAFDPNKDNWHSEYEQLKDLLTPEEYAAAQESTLTAFYTPPAVIHAMYRALTRMGCVGGNVLEPAWVWVRSLDTAAAALIRAMQSSTASSWTVYRAASRSSYTRKPKFKSAATKRPTCRTTSLTWLSAMCHLGSIRSRTVSTTNCTFKFTITFLPKP